MECGKFVWFLCLCLNSAHCLRLMNRNWNSNRTSINYIDAFDDIDLANVTHSYQVISKVQLQSFEFKFDSIPGRRQLGIIGPESRYLLPEGIQVYPERQVFARDTKEKVSILNYHAVDKDALFMHNVAATQVLIKKSAESFSEIHQSRRFLNEHSANIKELQEYLSQEASVQLIEKRKIAEHQVKEAELAIEKAKVTGKEERETLELAQLNSLKLEENKDVLARERIVYEDTKRREQNQDLVNLQESSQTRLEQARLETEEYLLKQKLKADHERALIERNTSLEKANIDVEGRIKQQRMNEDIEMRQLQEKFKAEQVKLMNAIQSTFDNLGNGFLVLISDTEKLKNFVLTLVAIAFGVYFTKEFVRLCGRWIEQRMGKPSLIRETSRSRGLIGYLKTFFKQKNKMNVLSDVVVHSHLETRLFEISRSTQNARTHSAPYRHLLLYGPPGTGKTMAAKLLATSSGMDYAIMSGGDVGPLGADAVTELHAIFRWAQASPRGVLIFIDEAEAFLGCRATRKTHMSEHMRNALNALLFHTGTQSKHFMLVIATNRPEDLDNAVTDRIDDTLHFDLPGKKERVRLMAMYYNIYLVQKIPTANAHVNALDKYGETTKGMSGREIEKMMLYLQNVVYSQEVLDINVKLIDRVVNEKIQEHKRKLDLKQYTEK